MHQHDCGCNHDLVYCGHCDVVYCKKCKREWGHQHYYWQNWGTTYPYYYGGTTVQCQSGSLNLTGGINTCSHQ